MSWVTWPTWPPCPYKVKTLKIFFSRTNDRWPLNLVCNIVCACTTKIIQIMTLGWPWLISHQGQIWSHWHLYGKKWKLLVFGNYCSLWSQRCLKHSTKWVNEVECVSKVKVILWPWSKITQILMLKLVFLRNSWVIWNQSSCETYGRIGMKIYINEMGHMTNMAATPIYGEKTL